MIRGEELDESISLVLMYPHLEHFLTRDNIGYDVLHMSTCYELIIPRYISATVGIFIRRILANINIAQIYMYDSRIFREPCSRCLLHREQNRRLIAPRLRVFW